MSVLSGRFAALLRKWTPTSSKGFSTLPTQESHPHLIGFPILNQSNSNISDRQSFLRQRVVRWNNDKKCPYCSTEVSRNSIQKMENVCPKLWRGMTNVTMRTRLCPLYRHAEIQQVGELRSEVRKGYKASLLRTKD